MVNKIFMNLNCHFNPSLRETFLFNVDKNVEV